MATVTGPEAQRINRLSEIENEIMVVLRTIYGSNIPNPDIIHVPRWGNDPLQFGSYSNRPYGYNDQTLHDFRAPIGRLYMGGEAYALKDEGYVHSAYLSGIETAKAVIQCLKWKCSRKYQPSFGN